MYGTIYKITNKLNQKVYIGQTKRNIDKRFSEHKKHKASNEYLAEDMIKYGSENFIFQIIGFATNQNELNELEKEMICLYNSTDRDFGYNKSVGGSGASGWKHSWSDEAKIQNRLDKQGCRWFYNVKTGERTLARVDKVASLEANPDWIQKFGPGRQRVNHSEETKEKIRLSHKGVPHTEEQKRKHDETLRNAKRHWYTTGIPNDNLLIKEGDIIPEGYYLGKTMSQEFKDKISATKLARNKR